MYLRNHMLKMFSKDSCLDFLIFLDSPWEHRNIKTQGITTAETSFIKFNNF